MENQNINPIPENQPVAAAPPVKKSNGIGLAGFIISIVGIIFCWIPIINIIGLILVIISFILCLIGFIMGRKKNKSIVLSIIGLVISFAGIIIFIVVGVVLAATVANSGADFNFH